MATTPDAATATPVHRASRRSQEIPRIYVQGNIDLCAVQAEPRLVLEGRKHVEAKRQVTAADRTNFHLESPRSSIPTFRVYFARLDEGNVIATTSAI